MTQARIGESVEVTSPLQGRGPIYVTGNTYRTMLLLLSCFCRVRLCAIPLMAAHQDYGED